MTANASPGPQLRWFDYVIALLPIVLAFTGAIGLAVGPAACAVNLAIFKTRLRRLACMSIALVVAGVAFFVWAGLVVAMR